MVRLTFAVLAAAVFLSAKASANPFTQFEADIRAAYGAYRVALFATNAGDVEQARAALIQLDADWSALQEQWQEAPPPQYAEDPQFAATLQRVFDIQEHVMDHIRTNELDIAHQELEVIRSLLWKLRTRNSVFTFSDRMNAYHAHMERVANKKSPDMAYLQERAAILAYLALDIRAHPAPEAADPAYGPLIEGFLDSVVALRTAVKAEDLEAARVAAKKLKPAFAKLFLKFG